MLVVINGTVGVGKTCTARCLASEMPDAVWIEGDSLGFASPKNDDLIDSALNSISAHQANGVRVIVFDMFFDDQQRLDQFLSRVGLLSYVFYLSADEEEIANRIRERARQRAESEIMDSRRMRLNQKKMKSRGIEIDTNGKETQEVTAEIKKLISAAESLGFPGALVRD